MAGLVHWRAEIVVRIPFVAVHVTMHLYVAAAVAAVAAAAAVDAVAADVVAADSDTDDAAAMHLGVDVTLMDNNASRW